MALTTFVAGQVLTAQELNDSFAAVGGLVVVVPTSVSVTGGGSSGSVGAKGTVIFGTAATVSINGVFSATYDNYAIVCDFDSSAADMEIEARLRVAGVDNSTANSYVFQTLNVNSTTVAGARSTTTAWRIGQGASVATNGFNAILYRPFLADTTAYLSNQANSFSSAYLTIRNGTHNQNTSYDGITLLATTGTITGKVTVYGFGGL
jgi:hypothetical protein